MEQGEEATERLRMRLILLSQAISSTNMVYKMHRMDRKGSYKGLRGEMTGVLPQDTHYTCSSIMFHRKPVPNGLMFMITMRYILLLRLSFKCVTI